MPIENENAIAAGLSPTPATTSQTVVPAGAKVLYGWSLAESTGSAAAKVRLKDGGTSGKLLAVITLASSGSSQQFASEQAVGVSTGQITLEVVSGSVEGTLFWG